MKNTCLKCLGTRERGLTWCWKHPLALALTLGDTFSLTELLPSPCLRHFEANLLMSDATQLSAVTGQEPRDQRPRKGAQGGAAAMAVVFQPLGYRHSGGENPATAGSWHEINRRGTETWTFGDISHLTSLFLNAFTCCSLNRRYFGGRVVPLPVILQLTGTEKLEVVTTADDPRSCKHWNHHMGDSPECHQFV